MSVSDPKAASLDPVLKHTIRRNNGRHRPYRSPSGRRARTSGAEWMAVLPMDGVMLVLPASWNPGLLAPFAAFAVLALLLITEGHPYRARLSLSVLDELPMLVGKPLVAAAIAVVGTATLHDLHAVGMFFLSTLSSVGLLVAGRLITSRLISRARRRGVFRRRALLVGGGDTAGELARLLSENPGYGLDVVGYVDDAVKTPLAERIPHAGCVADTEEITTADDVDVLLLADGEYSESSLLTTVRHRARGRCELLVVPRFHQVHAPVPHTDHIGAIPIVRVRPARRHGPAWMLKRVLDLLVSGVTLGLAAPVFGCVALAVRVETGPGVLFRHKRVGQDGRVFMCLKFRSIRPLPDQDAETTWNISTDDRIGPVGRFIRRTSLDELPQLVNILKGDMTLVGPRPERPHFVDRFNAEVPHYRDRHRVPVGLTGLAQVSGCRGDTPIPDRARFDNYYIEHWSLWLDVKVLLRTFAEVLFVRGR